MANSEQPNKEDISVYDNKQLIRFAKSKLSKEFSEIQTESPFQVGRLAGFTDGNDLYSPDDFFGSTYEEGLYFKLRWADPIIASLLNFKKSQILELQYKIVPKSKNPTDDQILAATGCQFFMNKIPFSDLNNFIAETYDQVKTYGFCLYEISETTDGFMDLTRIPPKQIERFIRTDDGFFLQGVEVNTGRSLQTIPAYKLFWFGDTPNLGEYWGVSELRPLQYLFKIRESIAQNFISANRFEKGILYIKESEAGDVSTTVDSWQNAANFLMKFYNNEDSPLLLDKGLDINYLQVQNPSSQNFRTNMEYIDSSMREALFGSLNSLGISRTGSKALGTEFSISDAQKFASHANQFIKNINGKTNPHSNILEFITTKFLGLPKEDAPQIIIENNFTMPVENRIDKTILLLEKGIITKEQLGKENIKLLMEDLGLSLTNFESE